MDDRTCFGCGRNTPGPRFLHVVDLHDASNDQRYHYDCMPEGLIAQHPAVRPYVEAARSGIKDHELTKHIAAKLGVALPTEESK